MNKKKNPEEQALQTKDTHIVDVRNPNEFQQGSRPGSINIPLGELNTRYTELDKEKTIILYCLSGARSERAVELLKQKGFNKLINGGSWNK